MRKMRLFAIVLSALWFSLAGCASSSDLNLKRESQVQVDPLPGKSVEERLRFGLGARLKAGYGFGYVVAIRESGKSKVFTAGKKTLEPITPLAENDLTALASISKTFTGILVHLAAIDGKLKLETRLAEVFPELKEASAGGITVQELGLHESGLPRVPPIQGDPEDPWKDVTQKQILEALREFSRPALPAGAQKYPRSYSNWGYHVLGMVLQRVYKRPYADLVKNKILQPLGMTSSGVEPTTKKKGKKVRKVIPGFNLDADPRAPWSHSDVTAASGGVESTASDMAKFLVALENPNGISSAPKLARAILQSLESGIGWDSKPGESLVWKNGSTPSHSAVLILLPAQKKSIFIGTNSAVGPDTLASFAIGHTLTDEDLSVALPKRVPPAEEIQKLKGYFRCHPPIPGFPDAQALDVEVLEVLGQMVLRFRAKLPSHMQFSGGMLVPFSKEDVWTYIDGTENGGIRVLSQAIRISFPSANNNQHYECDKLDRAPEAYPALEK